MGPTTEGNTASLTTIVKTPVSKISGISIPPARPGRRLHPIYKRSPSPSSPVPLKAPVSCRSSTSPDALAEIEGHDLEDILPVTRKLFFGDTPVVPDVDTNVFWATAADVEEAAVVEVSALALYEAIAEVGVVPNQETDAEGAVDPLSVDEEAGDNNGALDPKVRAEAFGEVVAGDLPWAPELDAELGLRLDEGQHLDEDFINSCRFYSYDPQRPLPTNLDILFRLGNWFGTGVTKTELRQTLRRCKACRNFLYADMRSSHRCDANVLSVQEPIRDFVSAFLTSDANSGFTPQDFRRLLQICPRCAHVIQANRQYYHSCWVEA